MISLYKLLLALPRSLFVNFRCLPIRQAIRIPIVISSDVNIIGKLNRKTFWVETHDIKPCLIQIGFSNGSFQMGKGKTTYLKIGSGAKILFKGRCLLAKGTRIDIGNNSIIQFGHWFTCNSNSIISSGSKIVFEDYIRLGWNCTVIDGDGHDMYDCLSGGKINPNKEIHIGAGSWLCAHSTIMKGVHLAHETVVPYGSVITKSCMQPYTIYGGNPNKILRENVYRKDNQKNFMITIDE